MYQGVDMKCSTSLMLEFGSFVSETPPTGEAREQAGRDS